MSATTATTPAPAAAPEVAAPGIDSSLFRVQKTMDGLKAKTAKLLEENQKLKQQLAEQRTRGSRIRSIPKKPPSDATGGTA
jgi:hypothetical protein